jgi:hypothetical protein
MPNFNFPNPPLPPGHLPGPAFGGLPPMPNVNIPNPPLPPWHHTMPTPNHPSLPPWHPLHHLQTLPPGPHPVPPIGPLGGAHVGIFAGGPNAGPVVPHAGTWTGHGPAPITVAPLTVAQILAAGALPAPTNPSGSLQQGSIRQLQNLTRCLRAARDLRHLSLCIPGWSDNAREIYGHIFPDRRPIFHYLGLWFTWPKLRSMSLEGIYADEQDIISLIQRHSNTLRTLKLSKCSLCTGKWEKVVNEVVNNASMISTFTLDQVNEAAKIGGLDPEESQSWRYEGHLKVRESGDREFVRIHRYEGRRALLTGLG